MGFHPKMRKDEKESFTCSFMSSMAEWAEKNHLSTMCVQVVGMMRKDEKHMN